MSDTAILAELGTRLARRRIDMQLTQAALAREAGISKRTVERLEAGASAQMASLIRVLRVLDLVSALDRLVPPAGSRPMELVRNKGRQRQRASSPRRGGDRDEPWTWNE
jgi:transcriptional regulator with XRE-family HTH domain